MKIVRLILGGISLVFAFVVVVLVSVNSTQQPVTWDWSVAHIAIQMLLASWILASGISKVYMIVDQRHSHANLIALILFACAFLVTALFAPATETVSNPVSLTLVGIWLVLWPVIDLADLLFLDK